MRTIKYYPKQTAAKTQYIEIIPEDFAFITQEVIKISARILELDTTTSEDWRLVREQFFHRRRKDLPRGKEGYNTPASFLGGLTSNLVFGTQRDLSEHQMQGLETIFGACSMIYDDIDSIRFQIAIL